MFYQSHELNVSQIKLVEFARLTHAERMQAVSYMADLESVLHATNGWSKSDIIDSASMAHNHILLMTYEVHQVIGYAIYSKLFATAELYRIGVHPNWQCQGVGRTLLNHVIDKVNKENAETLYLEVDEMNIPALRLYSKLGFKEYHRRQNYYRQTNAQSTDAVLMQLMLNAVKCD